MKKINLIYLAVFPLLFALYYMQSRVNNATAFFYGFAENKETELSHDRPVMVDEILVTPGQPVTKGQLLMKVQQAAISQKMTETSIDLERLELIASEKKQNLRSEIQQLRLRRANEVAEIEQQIRTVEATLLRNRQLREGLTSIATVDTVTSSALELELETLRARIALETEPIDLRIRQLQRELSQADTPVLAAQRRLKSEIDYYETEREALSIRAPSDGIIGTISCKMGENMPAFSTLINFYERNPTQAKGYVHESLIPEVKVGDQLQVSSSLHPGQPISGTVIGLGTRIVEIPERLRKIPDFKTYGREVLISIPSDNTLLQKEKVMVNTATGNPPSLRNLFSF